MMNKGKIIILLNFLVCFTLVSLQVWGDSSIDRRALVKRHNPTLEEAHSFSPFTVGNGGFGFTADVTGLQTFPEFYEEGIPLGTLSDWGWHTIPSKKPYRLEDTFKHYESYGRKVPYASQTRNPAGQWLRANPHRLHLGRIGFRFQHEGQNKGSIQDLKNIKQTLNLWEGILHSTFQIHGYPVQVTTVCHPERDMVAVRIETEQENISHVPVSFAFPYGAENWGPTMAEWNSPEQHRTEVLPRGENQVVLRRVLDDDEYYVRIGFSESRNARSL